jgi:hypothetical protein
VNLFSGLSADGLLQLLQPKIEAALEPLWQQTREQLLERIAGAPPPQFASKVRFIFDVSDQEISALWRAAVDAVAWGNAPRPPA